MGEPLSQNPPKLNVTYHACRPSPANWLDSSHLKWPHRCACWRVDSHDVALGINQINSVANVVAEVNPAHHCWQVVVGIRRDLEQA